MEQYDPLMSDLANFDDAYIESINRKIGPPWDLLLIKVRDTLRAHRVEIKEQINRSSLSETEKAFLTLNFDFLLKGNDNRAVAQDSLNLSANQYLTSYPRSRFEDYVRKYIRFEFKNSNWGLGFEFFSGYGVFTDNLREQFKNHVSVGVAFDICYKKFTLFLRDYIGFSRTLDSITFNNNSTWRKDSKAQIFLPEASLGYVTLENKKLKLIPFLGISSTDITPIQADIKKIPEYENVGLKFTTTYTVGLNLDFKLGKARRVINRPAEPSYWFLRIRYAYNKPQFDRRYNRFNGAFHYLTIGIGALERRSKRDY